MKTVQNHNYKVRMHHCLQVSNYKYCDSATIYVYGKFNADSICT